MDGTYRRINSVAKTLELLKYLASNGRKSITSISQAMGLPKNTVFCYVATLSDHNFIRVEGDMCEIGMQAARLWAEVKARKERQLAQLNDDLKQL